MLFRLIVSAAASALLSACATSGNSDEATPRSESRSPIAATAPSSTAPETSRSDPSAAGPTQLEIVAGRVRLIATLRDTQAARDLIEQLPLTLSMGDHGGVEKNGSLPQALSIADDPDGADPEVADLGYYAPSNDLVIYYGDQSYYDGIVILGRLQGDVGAIAEMDDLDVQVRRFVP